VTPAYRFFNGRSYFYQFGDATVLGDRGRVVMSEPLGDVTESGAKIHPYKLHTARQPADPSSGRLLPLKIGIFFQTGDLTAAVEAGAAALGWALDGFESAETERYMGLFHEVAPSEQALRCGSCHGGSRLDFGALGYEPKTTRGGKPLVRPSNGGPGCVGGGFVPWPAIRCCF